MQEIIKKCNTKIKGYLRRLKGDRMTLLVMAILGIITLLLGEGASAFIVTMIIAIGLFLYKDEGEES